MTHIHNNHVILHSSLIKTSSGHLEATSRNFSPVSIPKNTTVTSSLHAFFFFMRTHFFLFFVYKEKNVFQSMAQTGEETEGEARRPHEAEAQDVAGKSKRGSDDGFAERADDASGAARPPAGLAYPGFVEEVSTPPPRAAVRSLGES
jgi:hypothetical protein